jgi:hypothetical protein
MTLDVVAWLLVGLALANVSSTVILVLAAMRHPWPALEERATVAVILAIVAVAAAILGLQQLRFVELGDLWIVLLSVGLMLVSLPSIIWALAYWRGRFSGADTDSGSGAYDGRGDH